MKLLINEIFYSIQGETVTAGFPSVFIRLTGCNLNCRYCDTMYARVQGKLLGIPHIISLIQKYPAAHHITITGGEPLLQPVVNELLAVLCDLGFTCQLETNGSLSYKGVPRAVRKIVDVKTPSSGESGSFWMDGLSLMGPKDEFKFVIADTADYEYARNFMNTNLMDCPSIVNFSPVYGEMPYEKLAGLILQDGLKVRLNLQMHKIIWCGEEKKIDETLPDEN